jgi:hypothetical protein
MTDSRGWLAGGLVVLAGLGLWLAEGPGRADDDSIKQDVRKIADAFEKHDTAAAQQAAAALAKKPDADVETLMNLFKPRSKGGLGVGDKPGVVKRDGIEIKLQDLDKKAPSSAEVGQESAALTRAGYVAAAIAEAVRDKVPQEHKAKLKEWQLYAKEMQKAGLAFAESARGKSPDTIHKAAKQLNDACIKCHDAFR